MKTIIAALAMLDQNTRIKAQQYAHDEGAQITEFLVLPEDKTAIEGIFNVDTYPVNNGKALRFFSNDSELAAELEALLETLQGSYFDLTVTPEQVTLWFAEEENKEQARREEVSKLAVENNNLIADLEKTRKWIESEAQSNLAISVHADTVRRAIASLYNNIKT